MAPKAHNPTASKAQASIATKAQASNPAPKAQASAAPKGQASAARKASKGARIHGRQCKFYINGDDCPFDNRRGGCWDIHDIEARRAHLAKLAVLNQPSVAEHQKAQNETVVATQNSSTAASRAHPSTAASNTQLSTPSEAPKGGRIHGRQCKFYINGNYCPFINRRGGCRDIHDIEARRANLAKLSALNQLNVTRHQQHQNQAIVATPDSSHVTLQILPEMITPGFAEYLDNLTPVVELPYGLQPPGLPRLSTKPENYQDGPVTVSTSNHSTTPFSPISEKSSTTTDVTRSSVSEPSREFVAVESAPEQHWDFANHYERWASLNLNPETAAKYLKDINKGRVPRELLSTSSDAPITSNGVATTFYRFAELPFELRDQVWRQAIMAQDGITCRVSFFVDYDTLGRPIERKILPMGEAPTFFLVNMESRVIAKQMYKYMKAFGTPDYPAGTCYFNFNVDRLFLNLRSSKEYGPIIASMHLQDRLRVRHLVIPLKDLIRGDEKLIGKLICIGFSRLQTLTIIFGDGRDDWQWTRDMHQRKQIIRWNQSLWPIYCKKRTARGVPPPAVEFEKVPAFWAHQWKIDEFKW